MKNLKKLFGISNHLGIVDVQCITKGRSAKGDDTLQKSLSIILATRDSLYSYSFFDNELSLLCNASKRISCESDSIRRVVYDDITDSVVVCLSGGCIASFQFDDGSLSEANVVAEIPDGVDSAEWSPDGETVVVFNASTIRLLSATYFNTLCEIDPCSSNVAENAHLNVGWGSKETQFHGSEGKAAAKKTKVQVDISLIGDDHKSHISWRGDSQLFSVSYWDQTLSRRFIKMFDKVGSLLAVNEEMTGITGPICWRPYGDLLAFSERSPDSYMIGFLEKNGLKHGDFVVSSNMKIKQVNWNSNSTILGLICYDESSQLDCLLLWTTSNYHWYLKQKIVFTSPLVCLMWDDSKGERVYGVCQDGTIFVSEWIFTVDFNREWCLGSDNGLVSVINNDEVLLTSFKEAVIPPPMSRWSLKCTESINSVLFPSWSLSDPESGSLQSYLCTILHNNHFVFWKRNGSDFIFDRQLSLPLDRNHSGVLKSSLDHWVWFEPESFATVQVVHGMLSKFIVFTGQNSDFKMLTLEIPICAVSLNYLDNEFLIQSKSGHLLKIKYDNGKELEWEDFMELPEPCHRLDLHLTGLFCLSRRNRLYKNCVQVASQVTSFLIHGSFLLTTTSQHTLVIYRNNKEKCQEICTRKLENGSRLVVAAGTKVIVQLPRGNLEAIEPRALILEAAGRLLADRKFKEAVSLLSRQRIDLNLVVDHDPQHFLTGVEEFVRQVDIKWLTLFITELKPESVTSTLYSDFYPKNHKVLSPDRKVKEVCQALHSILCKDKDMYVLPILGTLVKTGNMSEALDLAGNDESLQHLMFLVDVDTLYNQALLAYNLQAALRIAGKSQKDPKEYLPYLNKLRSMDPDYMKYTIDKSLGSAASALVHLSRCQEDARFTELLQLIKNHSLYSQALKLFPTDSTRYKEIADIYGDHLMSLKRYSEAGVMYRRCGSPKKAIEPYLKLGDWRRCISMSEESHYSEKDREGLVERLRGVLKGTQRFEEAALLCLEVQNDPQSCLDLLLQGKLWNQALRLSLSKPHLQVLVDDELKKALLEHVETLAGEIRSCSENMSKYVDRLKIVRENKASAVDGEFKNIAEPWENTGYDASSIVSSQSVSSRSSRNTRKTVRKMWSLKEGNPREEMALVSTISSLLQSIDKLSVEVHSACLSLVEINCDEAASGLQSQFRALLNLSNTSRSSVWPRDPDVDEVTLMDERLKIPPQLNVLSDWELDVLKS